MGCAVAGVVVGCRKKAKLRRKAVRAEVDCWVRARSSSGEEEVEEVGLLDGGEGVVLGGEGIGPLEGAMLICI